MTARPLETIGPDDTLYRLISPQFIEADGGVNLGVYYSRKGRPNPQISVDLARLTTRLAVLLRSSVDGTGVGELIARTPLELGLAVVHCPDAATGNWAHAEIRGATTFAHCEALARAARLRPERRTPSGIDTDATST